VSRSWYLVRTRPLSEYKAAAALERSGFELYFPRVQTPRPRRGHGDTPLFPGYLFIRHGQNGTGLPPIARQENLLGWVKFDGIVPSVPAEVIDEMTRRLDTINNRGGLWKQFQPGEAVSLTSGHTEILAEVLERPDSPQSRVRVLLHFMGRLVQARVPWEDLKPAGNTSMMLRSGRPPRRTRGKGRWIRGFGPGATARA